MDDPVTEWMRQLQSGSPESAQRIWEHYCQKLQSFARKRLSDRTRRVYDEEDVAISAFHSMCQGIVAGKFPELTDRDNLWRILLTITVRKIAIRRRYDHRDKRNLSKLIGESGLFVVCDNSQLGLDAFAVPEPTPEFAFEVAETYDLLFNRLSEDDLKRIARLKVEGYTNGEIAGQLGVTRRTVERKLERIRREWHQFKDGETLTD